MSGCVNKAIVVGHLGRDPEVRRMNNGNSVVSFSLATSETWRDKQTGERKDRTEWHNVVIFNESLGKIAEQYCKKGSKVYVEGKMASREYEDRDGNKRRITEIVLENFCGELTLLDKSERSAPDPDSYGQTSTRSDRETKNQKRPLSQDQIDDHRMTMGGMIDDDIPF